MDGHEDAAYEDILYDVKNHYGDAGNDDGDDSDNGDDNNGVSNCMFSNFISIATVAPLVGKSKRISIAAVAQCITFIGRFNILRND